ACFRSRVSVPCGTLVRDCGALSSKLGITDAEGAEIGRRDVPERGGWTKSGRTRSLMSAAAEAWRRGLVDVSASNKRLFYAPLRVGTLLLADANASAMVRLLRGDAVKLADLVADDGTAEGLTRAARARKAADLLFAKGKIGEEETGDNPVRLALGLASWTPETALVGAP